MCGTHACTRVHTPSPKTHSGLLSGCRCAFSVRNCNGASARSDAQLSKRQMLWACTQPQNSHTTFGLMRMRMGIAQQKQPLVLKLRATTSKQGSQLTAWDAEMHLSICKLEKSTPSASPFCWAVNACAHSCVDQRNSTAQHPDCSRRHCSRRPFAGMHWLTHTIRRTHKKAKNRPWSNWSSKQVSGVAHDRQPQQLRQKDTYTSGHARSRHWVQLASN